MDESDDHLQRLHERQMQFLKTASPDDWHRYAVNHSWDDRLDGLYWIVSQPSCDKATALMIFWRGEPTGYDYETEDEPMGDNYYSVAPMLRHIAERFNTTGYARSEIAYDYLEAIGVTASDDMADYVLAIKAGRVRDIELLIDRQRDLPNPRIKLHPDLTISKIPGRNVGGFDDDSDFYKAFPQDADDVSVDPGEPLAQSAPRAANLTQSTALPSAQTDLSSDASSRIRAMRQQAGQKTEIASGSGNSCSTSDQSSKPAMTRIAATMGDALAEAAGLFAAVIALGFAAAFAPNFLFPNTASLLFWLAAFAGSAYCLYFAFSSLRALHQAAEAQGLRLSSGWIKMTTTVAVIAGIVLGRSFADAFTDTALTSFTRYSFIAVGVAAMAALSYGLARVLIHPRAVRWA